MQYYIETASGHDLVLDGIDQLTFASGCVETAYERVLTTVTDDQPGRTSRTDLQAAVLTVVSQEILEVSHADVHELDVILDVTGDDVETVIAATFEEAVSTFAQWHRLQDCGKQNSRTKQA